MDDEFVAGADDFIEKSIDEKTAIDLLLNCFEGNYNKYSDLNIFNNILYGETYLQNWRKYTGCFCLKNFLATDIGLNIHGKPGEIDILLLPFDDEQVYYDKATAIEVKVAKPHIDNLHKGANSDGFSQVMGLVKAGFPYVGLVHVVLSNPLQYSVKPDVKFMKRPANAEEKPNRKLPSIDEFDIVKMDWLPLYAKGTQMKRLLSYDIPKYIGLKVLSINFHNEEEFSLGITQDWVDFECGYINPYRKKDVVELIRIHHSEQLKKYREIRFNLPWAEDLRE